MKTKHITILAAIVVLLCACSSKTKSLNDGSLAAADIPPSLSVVRNYSYDYNNVALDAANREVHVICSVCPDATVLEKDKEADDVISMKWGNTLLGQVPVNRQPRVITMTTPTVITNARTIVATAPTVTTIERAPRKEQKEKELSEKLAMAAILLKDQVKTAATGTESSYSCLDAPVLFDLDKDILKDEERAKLKAAIERIKSAKSVKVVGYTCDLGTQEHNDDLAMRRAETVAKYLEIHGVKSVQASGKGLCCYISKEAEKNRRAEVNCLKSAK